MNNVSQYYFSLSARAGGILSSALLIKIIKCIIIIKSCHDFFLFFLVFFFECQKNNEGIFCTSLLRTLSLKDRSQPVALGAVKDLGRKAAGLSCVGDEFCNHFIFGKNVAEL